MLGQLRFIEQSLGSKPMYNGGGGTSDITQINQVAPELLKAYKPALSQVADEYKKGEYSKVAGTGGVEEAIGQGQTTAAGLKQNAADQMDASADLGNLAGRFGEGRTETRDLASSLISGTNAGAQRDLKNLQGNLMSRAAAGGALTSARNQRALQGALADRSLQYQQQGTQMLSGLGQQAQSALGTGINLQTQAGQNLAAADEANLRGEQTKMALEQQKLDQPYSGASKFFSLLQGTNLGSTSTQESSGGK